MIDCHKRDGADVEEGAGAMDLPAAADTHMACQRIEPRGRVSAGREN